MSERTLDRIQEIDTGAIEELTRIRREQEVLEDRLRLMTERREGVSEVVFERVRGDYRGRLEGLDRQARPLKESARREYAKLAALRAELQRARDDAQLEKEEADFRNNLGEFTAEEYEQRAAESAERLHAGDAELAEVEALRQRFLGACRSPEELEGGAAVEDAEEPGPTAVSPLVATGPGASAAEAVGVVEVMDPAVEEPFAAMPPPPPPAEAEEVAPLLADQDAAAEAPPPPPGYDDFGAGPTSLLEPAAEPAATEPAAAERVSDDATFDSAAAAPADLSAPPDLSATRDRDDWHEAPTGSFDVPPLPAPGPEDFDDDAFSGATKILSRPRLVEVESGAAPREHALALGRTSIGRASDNVVHLLDEAVSRHHAEVVPGPHGYLLRDLGSENGIYVNGERAPEHVLREGDVIQIGARTLVFHGA
jgi:hypothetical protein